MQQTSGKCFSNDMLSVNKYALFIFNIIAFLAFSLALNVHKTAV